MAKKSLLKLFSFNDELEAKCKLPDEWFKDFEEIGQDEMKILVLIAMVGRDYYEFNRVLSQLKGIGYKKKKEILEKLYYLGFLDRDNFYFWNDIYTVEPAKLIFVILYVLDRHPECIAEMKKNKVEAKGGYQILWEIIADYYNGERDFRAYRDSELFRYFEVDKMLYPFLGTELLDVLCMALPNVVFFELISTILIKAYIEDSDKIQDVLDSSWRLYDRYWQGERGNNMKSTLNDYINMFELIFKGHWEREMSSTPNNVQYMIQAVLKLYQGDDKGSLALFEETLKIYNKKDVPIKNVIPNQVMCFYLLLCYAKNNEVKKASVFVNKSQLRENELYYPALLAAWKLILNDTTDLPDHYINALLKSVSPIQQAFGVLFAKLAGENSNIVVPKKIEKRNVNCALLRYELNAIGVQCKDKDVLREALGGEPILSSFRIKPKWEALLDGLKTLTEIKGKDVVKEKKSERLIYVVENIARKEKEIFLYRQKFLKSGKWGKPFSVSTISYMEKRLNCLEQIDYDIINALLHSRLDAFVDSFPCDLVLPHLIGSDKVYYFDNKKDEYLQVEVVEQKPYIQLDKSKNGYVVTTNVPINITKNKLEDAVVAWNGNTQAIVYRLTEFEREAIYKLGKQNTFPIEAEKYLKKFIYDIQNHLEVHSDLVSGGSLLNKVRAASVMTLRLEPIGDSCGLQVYIVPTGGSKLRLFPGRGMAVIYDEIEGKRCQVERDLKAEKQYLEILQAHLMESVGSMIECGESLIMDLEMVLNLLQFVRVHSEVYQVEWPEGKSYKLKGVQNKTSNSINIVSKEDWFEVEGKLMLDEKKMLTVVELLRLMQQGRVGTRFVRLNDDEFLALNDSLAKQLQKLEKIAQIDSKKVRINRLQVGELAKIVQSSDNIIQSDNSVQTLAEDIQKAANMPIALPKGLQAQLRDYQQVGYEWISRLASWGAGACLADDMGLGKTVQAIAFLLRQAKQGPSMVVAPTSVVFNWQKEIERFAPILNVHIFNEANDRTELINGLKNNDVLLTTYGLIVREEEIIKSKKWNVICLDEAHTIKNRATKMSQVAMELQSKNRLLLTGTPVQNHLGELWNLFQFLNPGLLGSYEWFNRRYIQPIEQGHNEECRLQLRKLVQPFILRRTKSEVVEELPDKIEMIRQIELTDDEKIAYEALRMDAQQSLEQENKVSISVLSNITRLREAACSLALVDTDWIGGSSKLEDMSSLVTQITEEGNRVLIFSQFTSFLTRAKEIVDKMGIESFYLDGSTPLRQRKNMVEQFQQGEKSVFFISLKAGGLGLNLTGANYVIHLDPWWNPAIEQQATDRAYRIGQEQKVTVYHLIAKNTIEEKILRLHQSKRDIADSILEGTNVSHALNLDDLKYLLEM